MRDSVLSVITIAHCVIATTATLVSSIGEMSVGIAVDDSRAITVSGLELSPKIRVINPVMAIDGLMERKHQVTVALAQRAIIVIAGDSSICLQGRNRSEQDKEGCQALFHFVTVYGLNINVLIYIRLLLLEVLECLLADALMTQYHVDQQDIEDYHLKGKVQPRHVDEHHDEADDDARVEG